MSFHMYQVFGSLLGRHHFQCVFCSLLWNNFLINTLYRIIHFSTSSGEKERASPPKCAVERLCEVSGAEQANEWAVQANGRARDPRFLALLNHCVGYSVRRLVRQSVRWSVQLLGSSGSRAKRSGRSFGTTNTKRRKRKKKRENKEKKRKRKK